MPEPVASWYQTFTRAFRNAFPIILFFLTAFCTVYLFFGLSYVILVSIITVFFQGRYQQNNSLWRYLRLLFLGTLLLLLAYLSSRSLMLCILLNILVPFVLVFTQSSQFNPKGYFSYAMLFVFLTLMPPTTPTELLTELVVFWFCVCLLTVSLWGYRYFFGVPSTPLTLDGTLSELAELIPLLIYPERQRELEQRFQQLLHDFHQLSYHQNFFSIPSRETQVHDMVATLVQRFSYLISDYEWRGELDQSRISALEELSAFLRETVPLLDTPAQARQLEAAQQLLNRMSIPEGRIRIFCRSLLHMLILLLRTRGALSQPPRAVHRISWGELLQQTRLRLSLESFEMRFAMRLSIVMALSCTISYVLPITHSYWIPLNAFLLLQPSCEDSSYRMKTRPIGTLIGCCIEFLVYPFLPSVGVQLLFALVMISLMYCSTPGTWYQPIFSTCYALTLTSMTLNETTAITLRIVYLGAAVILVFLVNRFFFPIRKEALFTHNIKALFSLHNRYWDIIRKGLSQDTELSVSCEILTHFHMLYEECVAYLKRASAFPLRNDLQTVLLTLWHMFSELEQMHYMVRAKRVDPEEKPAILDLISAIQKDLYPIIRYQDFTPLKEQIHCRDKDLAYLLHEYLGHAESLLQYKACIPF